MAYRLAFSGDGQRLISGGLDHRLNVRPLTPAALRALACERAGRNLTRAEWRVYVPDYVAYRTVCGAFPAGQ